MKRDIITKKHNLCRKSFELRSAKFQLPMTREKNININKRTRQDI